MGGGETYVEHEIIHFDKDRIFIWAQKEFEKGATTSNWIC